MAQGVPPFKHEEEKYRPPGYCTSNRIVVPPLRNGINGYSFQRYHPVTLVSIKKTGIIAGNACLHA
jgi:hypothetical protein